MKNFWLGIRNVILLTGCFYVLVGIWLLSGVIYEDKFLAIYGLILFFLGLTVVMFISVYVKSKSWIFAILITASFVGIVFCLFAFFDIIPGLESKPIYGLLSMPIIVVCGSTTTVCVVTVKVKNKRGELEKRQYEVKRKRRVFDADEVTVRRIK